MPVRSPGSTSRSATRGEPRARLFAAHYDSFTWLWRKHGTPQAPQPDLRTLIDEHLLFVGSPTSVADQIAQVIDATGIDYIAGAFAWGTLSRDDALRSIGLFDTEVIPAVCSRVD